MKQKYVCEICKKEVFSFSKRKYCSYICYNKSRIGKPLSKETVEKIKKGLIGYKHNEEFRKKARKRQLGKKRTKLECLKTSQTLKQKHKEKRWGFGVNPVWNKGMKGFRKGIPKHNYDEKFRDKISKITKERMKNPDVRKKMRETQINLIKSGIVPIKNSKIEQKMKQILQENNYNFIEQWKYELGIADFFLPNLNIVIEVDGNYWHNLPKRKERDAIHNKWFTEHKYNIIRFSENDMKNEDFVKNRLWSEKECQNQLVDMQS